MTKQEKVKVIDMLEEAHNRLTRLKIRVLEGTISAEFICTGISDIQEDLKSHGQAVARNEVDL